MIDQERLAKEGYGSHPNWTMEEAVAEMMRDFTLAYLQQKKEGIICGS